MTHRVHPKAFRIKEIGDWDSRGYYKEFAKYLEEDFRIREFLRKKIGKLGVEKIEIERFPGKLNIIISSARPGLIIGRGGDGVEELRKELQHLVLKKTPLVPAYSVATEGKEKKKLKKKKKSSLIIRDGVEEKTEIKIEIR
ncbi:KH domain-containing protein, partial [Patescibacteria group bacterium]|nr:KH domain-containing protein [Patescibacteria group bacterium]